jgi:hypothetical protein
LNHDDTPWVSTISRQKTFYLATPTAAASINLRRVIFRLIISVFSAK